MASKMYSYLTILLAVCILGGCYTTPVRHLASDVALLQVGTSTKEDVIIYLGEADEQQDMGDGVQKWLYKEKNVSLLQRTPLVGSKLGSPEYNRVVVTLKNGIVSACDYGHSDEDDMDWAKDFSWQEKKK